jgi:PleD family two-component response regulator
MLLAHADRYLYQSKEGGRNRVTSPNSRALAA